MSRTSKAPLRRSFTSVPSGYTTSRRAAEGLLAGETSPLLQRQGSGLTFNTSDLLGSSSNNARFNDGLSDGRRSPELYRRNHSRARSLRKFLSTTLGRDQKNWLGTEGTPYESGYHHGLYDQYTCIDWMRDGISDSLRQKDLRARKGLMGKVKARLYDAEGWILAALVGIVTALVTYLIDISEASLFDAKFGYCSKNWLSTNMICCSGAARCDEWMSWSQVIYPNDGPRVWVDFALYVTFMLALTLLSCLLVLRDKHIIRAPRAGAYTDKSTATVEAVEGDERRQIVLYPSAGSGVAEVKVISSGFIIHGFLGTKTIFVKSLGCILSVASGLSIGKEGPYVHIAACVGNIISRCFPSYRSNAAKRREIISASSAAGIAVAFGAPISGVVFSLEEVSYYFPPKTFFRTFFCSIIAAVTLKFLNPYLNGQIVPFEVKYHSDWRAFEMPLFVFLGILGGAIGAVFVKGTRLWTRTFRNIPLIKKWPLLEAFIIAIVTGVASYWNRYTKLPVGEMMFELASDCRHFEKTGTGLCPSATEIPSLIGALGTAFLVKGVLTMITFGVKVPAGIYVPSMVIGGLLGRAFGHAIQYAIISSGNDGLIGTCVVDGHLEGCIVPGVYALITAGATMCGVTRLSLTLALILFELTGSLDHVLPFSIAVLVAKWTADAIEPQSIYDLYMEMHDYPYLDNKSRKDLMGELADFTPRLGSGRTIDITNSPVMPAVFLREKLDFLVETGQFDGGLPILKDDALLGIISCPDLAYCLDRLEQDDEMCYVSPRPNRQYSDEDVDDNPNLTDFSTFIDPSPVALDVHSSAELVYECFVKLGLRYLCVLRDGYFVGLVHRKAFIKYAREA